MNLDLGSDLLGLGCDINLQLLEGFLPNLAWIIKQIWANWLTNDFKWKGVYYFGEICFITQAKFGDISWEMTPQVWLVASIGK